jgi:hypothetical protein
MHWGFNADAFFDAKRVPTFPTPPKKIRSAQERAAAALKRARALDDEGEGSSRPAQPGAHGMSREQAEKLMAMLAACSPTGRAFAKAQQEKEAAERASIESWAHQTRSAYDVSTWFPDFGQVLANFNTQDDSPEPDGAHDSQPMSDRD